MKKSFELFCTGVLDIKYQAGNEAFQCLARMLISPPHCCGFLYYPVHETLNGETRIYEDNDEVVRVQRSSSGLAVYCKDKNWQQEVVRRYFKPLGKICHES